MILRFLRCFAIFREMERELSDTRTALAIARDRSERADAEVERVYGLYEQSHKGHLEAMQMLANVSVQVHIGTKPPYPDVWHLPERKPRPVNMNPVETDRIPAAQVQRSAVDQFKADIEELFANQQQ